MSKAGAFIKLMRPSQWTKNAFVFTGLIFSHSWNDSTLAVKVFITAIAFCFVSSSIYIYNDIFDADNDKHHPKKKNRPIPSGKVSVTAASIEAILLSIIGLTLGYMISKDVFGILTLYMVLNILYSYSWKKVVILDVFCISAGFMLRILAGTTGVGIPPSKWLLLCGLMLTLFLGFAKRRAEIIGLRKHKEEFREVLTHYDPIVLDELISISAASVIITYSLYTMSNEVAEIHHTVSLIYTVPFVIYALFRYIYLLHSQRGGDEPSLDLFKDPHIVAAVMGWVFMTIMIVVF